MYGHELLPRVRADACPIDPGRKRGPLETRLGISQGTALLGGTNLTAAAAKKRETVQLWIEWVHGPKGMSGDSTRSTAASGWTRSNIVKDEDPQTVSTPRNRPDDLKPKKTIRSRIYEGRARPSSSASFFARCSSASRRAFWISGRARGGWRPARTCSMSWLDESAGTMLAPVNQKSTNLSDGSARAGKPLRRCHKLPPRRRARERAPPLGEMTTRWAAGVCGPCSCTQISRRLPRHSRTRRCGIAADEAVDLHASSATSIATSTSSAGCSGCSG